MNSFYDENDLSETGLRRREEILQSAVRAARHRRLQRQAVQIGALAATAIVVLFITAPFWRPAPAPTAIVKQPDTNPSPMPAIIATQMTPRVIIKRFETDPTLLQRLAVPPQKPTWKTISDDELLKELAAAGHPAGLEYVNNGPVVVLYRNTSP